jgi:hypothetical protein
MGRRKLELESDQEVAVKDGESPPRIREDRLRTRLKRLQAIADSLPPGTDQVSRAVAALRGIYDAGGRQLTHIKVRPNFITRRAQPQGEMSDRQPPDGPRPPVLELVSPNGIAQQLELVALFVAQTTSRQRQDGRVPTLGLELDTTDANKVTWIDVIVPHAEHTVKALYAANRRDSRLRQVKRALDTLASKDLVELPNAGSARGKYEGFRLLDEGGPRLVGSPLPYRVPPANESVIDVPVDFFQQGWVYVLTKSEIALYFMLRHLRGPVVAGRQVAPVSIFGDDRLRWYGVGKDAYKGWWLLELAGLVDVEVDPGRRGDGTVVKFDPAAPPAPHRFQLQDDGLGKPAAAAVKAALAAALDQEPVGVSRVNTVLRDNPFDL